MAQKFSKETYLYWYELMQLIRQFESKSEEMYKMAGKIRGFFHVYNGQEAIAAGCMTATNQEDPFITAYRDHGLALAKGMSPNAAMAELYGKATGCSKGTANGGGCVCARWMMVAPGRLRNDLGRILLLVT